MWDKKTSIKSIWRRIKRPRELVLGFQSPITRPSNKRCQRRTGKKVMKL